MADLYIQGVMDFPTGVRKIATAGFRASSIAKLTPSPAWGVIRCAVFPMRVTFALCFQRCPEESTYREQAAKSLFVCHLSELHQRFRRILEIFSNAFFTLVALCESYSHGFFQSSFLLPDAYTTIVPPPLY